MLTVKLTTPWDNDYLAQSPGGQGRWGDIQFRVNDDCREADVWIVWGSLRPGQRTETVQVPPSRVIYLTDEAHDKRHYHQIFLNQFPHVVACREDLVHPGLVRFHEVAPWYFKKNYEQVLALSPEAKTDDLSIVMSNLLYLDGHVKRYGFGYQMMGHFKERLPVFGRGHHFIADKLDGLLPFRYSIALENSVIPDYFTEKIQECYLAYTMPIYFGCPNVTDYFDRDAMVLIEDLSDWRGAIAQIEEALAGNYWERRLPLIKQMRERVLTRYHLFAALSELVTNRVPLCLEGAAPQPRPVTVRSEQAYQDLDAQPRWQRALARLAGGNA